MANIDLEAPSTSVGPTETALMPTTSNVEEGAVGGVEIIHYQPPQVEYHETPSTIVTTPTQPVPPGGDNTTEDEEDEEPVIVNKSSPTVAPAESMESVRSAESESNELQSLMPQRKDSLTDRETEST